jgi:hypothetical protein
MYIITIFCFKLLFLQRRMVPADDFELIIISHLEHLVNLVGKDVETRRSISGPSACLDHFLSKNIISTVS